MLEEEKVSIEGRKWKESIRGRELKIYRNALFNLRLVELHVTCMNFSFMVQFVRF
jgi:hypothetical protein